MVHGYGPLHLVKLLALSARCLSSPKLKGVPGWRACLTLPGIWRTLCVRRSVLGEIIVHGWNLGRRRNPGGDVCHFAAWYHVFDTGPCVRAEPGAGFLRAAGRAGAGWVMPTIAFKPYACGTRSPISIARSRWPSRASTPLTIETSSARWAKGRCIGCGSRSGSSTVRRRRMRRSSARRSASRWGCSIGGRGSSSSPRRGSTTRRLSRWPGRFVTRSIPTTRIRRVHRASPRDDAGRDGARGAAGPYARRGAGADAGGGAGDEVLGQCAVWRLVGGAGGAAAGHAGRAVRADGFEGGGGVPGMSELVGLVAS